jgi:hypothetical protein
MLASHIGLIGGGGSRTVVISSNQTNYNLHTALGSPSTPVRVTVVINSGVAVSSNNTSTPAFDQGSLPAGSAVLLINNGSIRGMGGAGGAGTSFTSNIATISGKTTGGAGGSGGTALRLTRPTTVVNGAGEIFGGGGGGGGGAGGITEVEEAGMTVIGGSGGSGGRGGATSSGGAAGVAVETSSYQVFEGNGNAGNTGSSSGAGATSSGRASGNGGVSGAGGAGGDWGAAGSAGGTVSGNELSFGFFDVEAYNPPNPGATSFGSGGAAGKAVDLNGQSITWISGNDSTHVKGAVS